MDADPDPAYYFDPDPAYHFDADPDSDLYPSVPFNFVRIHADPDSQH